MASPDSRPDQAAPADSATSAPAGQPVAWGLVLVLAYVAAGKLSLLLALPPGYASAIFPPAGIAVAAAFVGGRWALPWVFIGSFLLNLWVGYTAATQWTGTGLAAALCIAVASALQAMAGGVVLRRLVGYPAPLASNRHVSAFLLSAPLICLTSATLSTVALAWLGIAQLSEFFTNWFAWWIGDTLGLLVMLPLSLVILGEPRPLWRRRARSVALPVAAAFALLVFIFVKASQWEHTEALTEFHGMAEKAAEQVRLHFDEQETLLEQLDGLMAHDANRRVSRQEFHRFVQASLARFSSVQAIEWIPRVEATERSAFEATQSEDIPGFGIYERSAEGRLATAAARPIYYPVAYAEPLAGNETALGFDLGSSPLRRETLDKAAADGLAVATPPLRLVQDREGQTGLLLLRAVKDSGRLRGYVGTVLRLGDFSRRALARNDAMLSVRLLDVETKQAVYDEFADSTQPLFARDIDFGTRLFRLEAAPTPAYLARHKRWESWGVLAIGLLGTSLLSALLLLTTGYAASSEALVQRRTRELGEAQEQLQLALRGADLALCDWGVDSDRLTFGEGWSRLLGYAREELPPRSATLMHLMHPDDVPVAREALVNHFKSLAPSIEAEVRLRHKDGHWVWIHARGTAVERSPDGRAIRVAGTAMDISERKRADENQRLAAMVFRHADEAIMICDSQQRIIDVNPAFSDISGYPRDEVLGRTPTLLGSGRHGSEFFQTMWKVLDREGYWESEVWNRHRNGELYLAHLRIAAVRDNLGRLTHYLGTFSDITVLRQHQEQLDYLAHHDPLTHLPNRVLLADRMQQALAQAKRSGSLLAVCGMDLDGFKQVNDELGHEAGDQLLIEIARRLKDAVREADTVARLGGDEFVLLLCGLEDVDQCHFAIDRVLASVAQPMSIKEREVRVSASVGVTLFPQDDSDADALLRHADQAMYQAKVQGRNRYRMFQAA